MNKRILSILILSIILLSGCTSENNGEDGKSDIMPKIFSHIDDIHAQMTYDQLSEEVRETMLTSDDRLIKDIATADTFYEMKTVIGYEFNMLEALYELQAECGSTTITEVCTGKYYEGTYVLDVIEDGFFIQLDVIGDSNTHRYSYNYQDSSLVEISVLRLPNDGSASFAKVFRYDINEQAEYFEVSDTDVTVYNMYDIGKKKELYSFEDFTDSYLISKYDSDNRIKTTISVDKVSEELDIRTVSLYNRSNIRIVHVNYMVTGGLTGEKVQANFDIDSVDGAKTYYDACSSNTVDDICNMFSRGDEFVVTLDKDENYSIENHMDLSSFGFKLTPSSIITSIVSHVNALPNNYEEYLSYVDFSIENGISDYSFEHLLEKKINE